MSNSSNRLATLVSGTSVTCNWTNGPRVFTLGDGLQWTLAADGAVVNAGPTMVVSDLAPNVTSLQTINVSPVTAHTSSSGDDPWPVPPPPPPPTPLTFPSLVKFLNKTLWTNDGLRVLSGAGSAGAVVASKRR